MVMGTDTDTGMDMVTTMNMNLKKQQNTMSRAGCQHWPAVVAMKTFRQGTELHNMADYERRRWETL